MENRTVRTALRVGDRVSTRERPVELIGVVAAVQGDRLLVRRPSDQKVRLFDREQLVRHGSDARLRRTLVVDALGRPIRDGARVQLDDGRGATVTLALGVRATLQEWESLPREQRGLVLVALDDGGSAFVRSGDVLVVSVIR